MAPNFIHHRVADTGTASAIQYARNTIAPIKPHHNISRPVGASDAMLPNSLASLQARLTFVITSALASAVRVSIGEEQKGHCCTDVLIVSLQLGQRNTLICTRPIPWVMLKAFACSALFFLFPLMNTNNATRTAISAPTPKKTRIVSMIPLLLS